MTPDSRDRLIEQLTKDEGLRLKPYRDTVGKLTIGVGRNLDDVGISLDEAEMLLAHDIERTEATLLGSLPWVASLDDVRQRVLLNMAFNVGVGSLLGFTHTLAFIREGQFGNAAAAMRDSRWARQVGARAERLARAMETGVE